MLQNQLPFDAFISYSSKDSHTASAMKQALQGKGIRCWKAPDDILPGESWPSAIMRAISHCRTMILVWTKNSMESLEVSKELTLAMRHNLTVIPYRIDDVVPVGDWEYHLANTHWMDASDGSAGKNFEVLSSFLLNAFPPVGKVAEAVDKAVSQDDLHEDSVEQFLQEDTVALGHETMEAAPEQVLRLNARQRKSAAEVTDIIPNRIATSQPPPLPTPRQEPSTHPLPNPPNPSPVISVQLSASLATKRNTSKLVLFGFLWCVAFYMMGSFILMAIAGFYGGKSAEEVPDAVKSLALIVMLAAFLLSPILAIYLTVKGKLPGTQKP